MDRYTRKDAEAAFAQLCEAVGRRQGPWNDVGAWQIDYNSVYGGYVVVEIVNSSGGQTHPLGEPRRPAREFCSHINFALRVMQETTRTNVGAMVPQ